MKEMRDDVWVSRRPHLSIPRGRNPPVSGGGVNEQQWRRRVGFTPPLFVNTAEGGRCVGFTRPHMKRKETGGSVWDLRCPRLKQKETGPAREIHAAPVRNRKKWGQRIHAAPVRNEKKQWAAREIHAAPVRN
jgi:hypothetical protein